MIPMSKKMTSQKKLGEIKLVPYNKPLVYMYFQPNSCNTHTVVNGLEEPF